MKRVLIGILTIAIILSLNIQTVFAFSLSSVLSGADNFNKAGASSATDITNELSPTITGLVSAGLGIGTVIAICAGIVIAIKVMSDGANGKKELKEALTPYVIGCVVLFASFGIWSGVVKTLESTIDIGPPGGGTLTPSSPVPPPDPVTPEELTEENLEKAASYINQAEKVDNGIEGEVFQYSEGQDYKNILETILGVGNVKKLNSTIEGGTAIQIKYDVLQKFDELGININRYPYP